MNANLSNPAAERVILSAICKHGKEAYLEVSDLVNSTSFTIDLNQGMWNCLAHLLEKNLETKIDFHIIEAAVKELRLDKLFENDHRYIQSILNFSTDLSNARPMAKVLQRLEVARDLVDKHNATIADLMSLTGAEPLSQVIATSEGKVLEYINSLSANNNSGIIHISDGLEEYLEYIETHPNQTIGISSGYPLYDIAIGGGIRRKTVNMIAARPGIGKTLLADSIGLHVADKIKIPVLELDSEMEEKQHWPRMIASMTQVPIYDIESGAYIKNPKQRDFVYKAKKRLQNMPFSYVNVSGRSFEEILALARRWILQTVGFDKDGRTNDCLLIYDYLKLMNSEEIKSGAIQERQALGFQMTSLHDFTVKYDIPCMSFVQVNRDGITKETSDIIADSDRILRLASSVFLYKEKDEEEIVEDGGEKNGNRKMVHIKTRFGGGLDNGDYINFHHTKNIAKIVELKTRNTLKKQGGSCGGIAVDDTPMAEYAF